MTVRHANSADRPAIRDIARRSLEASYSLSPQAITSAIEEWYGESRLEETLDDDDRLLMVVERDDQVVAFSESTLESTAVFEDGPSNQQKAMLLWLHVDPAYRGEGVGTELFDQTRSELREHGANVIQGRVLAENTEGNGFFDQYGFSKVGRREIEIDGRTHVENIYIETPSGMQELTTEDGSSVYVNRDESTTGSLAAFHAVYMDEAGADLYGYYCASCDNLANAMDAMGRIECDSCGNSRKPTRWDAAYM